MYMIEGLVYKFKDDIHYFYFSDESKLYVEGFQFLKAGRSNYLLNCYDLTFNGKVKLMYDTREYKRPFFDNKKMTFPEALRILYKLSEAIHQAFEEHYIKREGIVLNLDCFFEDQKGDLKLLYIPISHNEQWDESNIKTKLMKEIIQFLKKYNDSEYPFLSIFRRELMNDVDKIFKVLRKLSIKDDVVYFENKPYDRYENQPVEPEPSSKSWFPSFINRDNWNKMTRTIKENAEEKYILKLRSSDGKFSFDISQRSFVVGSLPPGQVDGSLSGHKGISRKHFEIIEDGRGEYWLTDLYSTNGTKLNKKFLKGSEPEKLKSGDVIEILNLKFFVNIEVI